MTSIVTNLTDFEALLILAQKYKLQQFKVDGIEVVMPPPDVALDAPQVEYEDAPRKSKADVDADLYSTLTNI